MSDFTLPLTSCLIAGMSGSGKNTAVYRYLTRCTGDAVCRFIFDDKGEAALRLGLPHVGTEKAAGEALQTRWVNVNPHRMFPGRLDDAFKWFCKWTFKCAKSGRGKKIIFIDEIWRFQDRDDIPLELAMLAQMGRSENIQLLTATQHLHKVNASITGNMAELICFKMIDSVDLRKAAQLGGDAEEIRNLPLYSYVGYNLKTGGKLRYDPKR